MTVRKVIVLNAGQLEQLQSGDRLDLGNTVNRTNNNVGAINIGQPVYSVSGTAVDLAQANAQATIGVAGLVVETSIDADANGDILPDGILTATTAEWDDVTGQNGGLTPGANYFLDAASAGKLTATAPTVPGKFVVRVGHALSATELEVEIQQPIKL